MPSAKCEYLGTKFLLSHHFSFRRLCHFDRHRGALPAVAMMCPYFQTLSAVYADRPVPAGVQLHTFTGARLRDGKMIRNTEPNFRLCA